MDPRMSARTNSVIYTSTNKFLKHFKVRLLVSERLILLFLHTFIPQMGTKQQTRPLECVLKCRNHLGRRITTLFALADSLGPRGIREKL